MKMTRRTLLASAVSLAATPARRPNILLLLGDNWAAPHASALGDPFVQTPTFDRVARDGVLFTHAFAPNPSCSPSRSSLLTGQETHRLGDAANLYGTLAASHATYPKLLGDGYFVGFIGKGWGPGTPPNGEGNPAGVVFESVDAFLEKRPKDKPFCLWFGSHDPHVPWDRGSKRAGAAPVPKHLPDNDAVREDIHGYYAEVEQFDRECGAILRKVGEELENTLVAMTSDNGWQIPRGLANCYDLGVRIPMAMRLPGRLKAGEARNDFVSIADLAPTFLDAAGIAKPVAMTAASLFSSRRNNDEMFLERERHANVRRGNLSYPVRGVRTRRYLYLRNLNPDRWPAGDPEFYRAVGPYGDVDNSLSKQMLLRDKPQPYFDLCFGKRPAEELYDCETDPDQVKNLASDPKLAKIKQELAAKVDRWMRESGDPRGKGQTNYWDDVKYTGPKFKGLPPPKN